MKDFRTTLRLDARNDAKKLRFDALSTQLGLFATALSDVANAVGVAIGSIHVEKLKRGSAVIGVACTDPQCTDLTRVWEQTVRASVASETTPETEAIKALLQMRAKAKSLDLSLVQIDKTVVFQDRSLPASDSDTRMEFVSVEGRLDEINVHRTVRFRVYPPGQNRGIQCVLGPNAVDDPSWLQRLREALRMRVTVSGRGKYRGNATWPSSIDVTEVRIHRPEEISPLVSIIGTGFEDEPDDPTRHIRQLRDEDG